MVSSTARSLQRSPRADSPLRSSCGRCAAPELDPDGGSCMQGEGYVWRRAAVALVLGLAVSLAPGLMACGGEEREAGPGAEAAQPAPSKEPAEAAAAASGSTEAAQSSAAARAQAEQIL